MRKTKRGSRTHANRTHERYGPGLQTPDGRLFCKDLLRPYCAVSVENKDMAKSKFYPHDTRFGKRGLNAHSSENSRKAGTWLHRGCITPAPSGAPDK